MRFAKVALGATLLVSQLPSVSATQAQIKPEDSEPPSIIQVINLKDLLATNTLEPSFSVPKIGKSLSTINEEKINNQKKNKVKSSPSFTQTQKGIKIIGYSNEQCVQYYQRVTGRSRSLGYAGNIKSQGNIPIVGSGALSSRYGHIMVVVAVLNDGILVHDANYIRGAITERFVPFSDVRGYIYK